MAARGGRLLPYPGCGRKNRATPERAQTLAHQGWIRGQDFYLGDSSWLRCDRNDPANLNHERPDPEENAQTGPRYVAQCGSLANYRGPDDPPPPAPPATPAPPSSDVLLMTTATTAVTAGGTVQAVVRSGADFRRTAYFDYLDPNVPCEPARDANNNPIVQGRPLVSLDRYGFVTLTNPATKNTRRVYAWLQFKRPDGSRRTSSCP